MNKKSDAGLTLVELLVYTAIFTMSALFLVGILGVTTKVQTRQSSVNEINQQIAAIQDIIKQLVQESSLIENEAGQASTALVLRMPETADDKTFIYAANKVLYLEQGVSATSINLAQRITNEKVKIDSFNVTKYENPGGLAVVQVNLVLSASTTNPQSAVTRTMQTAIARISAANFDSHITPNLPDNFNIGTGINRWDNAFFNTLDVLNDTKIGRLGVGVSAPAGTGDLYIQGELGIGTPPSTFKLEVGGGDVKFSSVSGSGRLVCVKNNNALGTCQLSGGTCTPCQ